MKAIKSLVTLTLIAMLCMGVSQTKITYAHGYKYEDDEPEVVAINATPQIFYALEGTSQPIQVSATLSDGTTQDVAADVSGDSTNEDIAYFDSGKVVAQNSGEVDITLSYNDVSTSIHVVVITPSDKVGNRFGDKIPFRVIFNDINRFDSLIDQYSLDNLYLIVPPKAFKKVSVIHQSWATDMKVTVDSSVVGVDVTNGIKTKSLKRIGQNVFQFGWAALPLGTELTFSAKDKNGIVVETKVIKVGDGKYEDVFNSNVQAGAYTLSELAADPNLFNSILLEYSMDMLYVGIPKAYVTNVLTNPAGDTVSYVVTTTSEVAHLFLVTDSGDHYYLPPQYPQVFIGSIPSAALDGHSYWLEAYDSNGTLLETHNLQ